MAWQRGWGQDVWGTTSPWGSPVTSYWGSDALQGVARGQYLTQAEAMDMQMGGHVIYTIAAPTVPVLFDESTLVLPGAW